jgi:hypothetical protein
MILSGMLLIFFIAPKQCIGQMGLSGYPLVNMSEGKNRWGGAMGIGQRKKSGEYWLNMEISVFTEKSTIPPAYQYFPPTHLKTTYTDVTFIFLYHKDLINRGNLGEGVVLFWEIGGGLDVESAKTEADFFASANTERDETATSLIMQSGVGLDINRRVRIRCNPFMKVGGDSVIGFQLSAFVLIGLNQKVKEEVEP